MSFRKILIGDFKFEKDETEVILDILKSNQISEGKYVELFSNSFANFIGTKYCIPVNSGTSAIMLSLAALKYHSKYSLNKSKKVITTPLTYIATANAIVTTGFEPEFVDINLDTFSLNIEQVFEKIENDDFFSIVPVHLMGYPCDMNALNKISDKYGVPIIEDACEAHGTEYFGKKTGSLGFAGCFSFFIAHNIQAGEFGCITTDDQEFAKIAKSMKGNGRRCCCTLNEIKSGACSHKNTGFHPRYIHDYIGYNFKVMEYQAAVAFTQLKKVEWINNQRRENVKFLNDSLSAYSDIIRLPIYSKEISYLGYPLLVINKQYSRDKIVLELEKKGIECRPIFNSIPTQQPAYSYLNKKYKGKVPNAEYVGNNGFYMGCHQYLNTSDLEHMVNSIKEILHK